MDKYWNPQKSFTALESNQVIRKKFLSKNTTMKERKILMKERLRLVDQAEIELQKQPAPSGFYPFKETKFAYEPYPSYLDELTWDTNFYQKPIRDRFVKAVQRGMYGTSKEKFDDIFRMVRM